MPHQFIQRGIFNFGVSGVDLDKQLKRDLNMLKWLHHLLHPHCDHCREERQEASICQTCEVLTTQLARAHIEKDNLLAQLERMNNPVVPIQETSELPEPLKPRMVPWAIRKNLLEAEDRKKAQLMREAKSKDPSIEKLEEEVGISNTGK